MIRTTRGFTRRNVETEQRAPAQPATLAVGQARLAAAANTNGRTCRYDQPAGLFQRTSSSLRYLRFPSAALALRHVNEGLTPKQMLACTMEVGDARFVGEELRALYLTPLYPLARTEGAES